MWFWSRNQYTVVKTEYRVRYYFGVPNEAHPAIGMCVVDVVPYDGRIMLEWPENGYKCRLLKRETLQRNDGTLFDSGWREEDEYFYHPACKIYKSEAYLPILNNFGAYTGCVREDMQICDTVLKREYLTI